VLFGVAFDVADEVVAGEVDLSAEAAGRAAAASSKNGM
jgi:hypothetical protein